MTNIPSSFGLNEELMKKQNLIKIIAVGWAILTLYVIWNDGKNAGKFLAKAFLNDFDKKEN